MEHQVVVFELADEHYGIDIAHVEGIIKMQEITWLPQAPDFVEGVTNLRGSILPVIDLRKRFHLQPINRTKDTRIVVVEIGSLTVGIVVDGVTEVLRIGSDAIESPSPIVATVDAAFITAIARLKDHMVILVDLSKMFSLDDQFDLQSMAAAA